MDDIRALYLIVEGEADARILHTLLDCSKYNNVYHIPAGGYNGLSSVAKTIRLMKTPSDSNDKIVVVFDADSEKLDVIEDRIATIRYLTNADYDNRIGVFCFVPTIEKVLFPKNIPIKKSDISGIVNYMKNHFEEMKEEKIIQRIQVFINE